MVKVKHTLYFYFIWWSRWHVIWGEIIFNRAAFLDQVCDLEVPTTHSLILRTFIESNGISQTLTTQNEYFSQVYNEVNDQQAQDMLNPLTDDEGNWQDMMTLEDAEALFESIIDANRKKQEGVVYTPDYIVKHLISESMEMIPKNADEITICDPACGSGGFLVGAAEVLKENGVDIAHAIENQIFGFDINEDAVQFAKSHLLLYLLKEGLPIDSISPQVFIMDTLLSKPSRLWRKANVRKGFDIVATNPPYVKLQDIKKELREKLLSSYKNYAKGSYSLALLFFVACKRMINKKGVIALITQNSLFTSKSALSVREEAQRNRWVARAVDFAHHLVFEGVLAYTCLVFLNLDKTKTHIEYRNMYQGVNADLLPTSGFSMIPYSELTPEKWKLVEDPHRKNVIKIQETGIMLGSLCKIYTGFATLRDKIYSCKKDNGGWYWHDKKNKEKKPIESEIIRTSIKIADFDNERDLAQNRGGMIFPYIPTDTGSWELIPEGAFKANYPLAYTHLQNYKEELAKRDGGDEKKQAKYGAWYGWGRKQGMNAKKLKLLTKTYDSKPSFKLDKTESIFCNGYAIDSPGSFENGATLSTKGLQKILNSRFMNYFVRNTAHVINGGKHGYPCFQKNFIELFGIPILNDEECKIIEAASADKVEQILSEKYDIPLKDIDEYFDY